MGSCQNIEGGFFLEKAVIGFSPCQDFKLTISLSGRGSHGVALGESSSLWLLKVKILRRKFFFVGKLWQVQGELFMRVAPVIMMPPQCPSLLNSEDVLVNS